MIISSEQNPTIKLVKQLLTSNRQRKKSALTVIEGTHLIEACLNADYPIKQVLVAEHALEQKEVCELIKLCEQKQTSILTIADNLYKNIRTLGTGIDIMAMIPITQVDLPTIHEDCLILNDVQDSGNVGTLLRTAAAIGIQHIICTPATAKAWSPKVLRASMGANFSLTIYENIDISELLDKVQTPMMATSSHTEQTIYQADLSTPVAWVMGHEGQGVCTELLTHAKPITIPQPNGQESLNVAIAGALCMYEMFRQRM